MFEKGLTFYFYLVTFYFLRAFPVQQRPWRAGGKAISSFNQWSGVSCLFNSSVCVELGTEGSRQQGRPSELSALSGEDVSRLKGSRR